MEPTPVRRESSGGLAAVPPAEEESPRRRLFASAAKDIKSRGGGIGASNQQHQNLSFVASTPPALASLLAPMVGGSPQALCCAGVSPRALFGGGRSVKAEAFVPSKRELLPPFSTPTPAVEPSDDEADVVVATGVDGRAENETGGLAAATHAETTAFAARWDFDVTSGSPLAGGRWEWLTTARKSAEEAAAAAAAGKEQEQEQEEKASDLAFRPKAFLPPAAACASDVTSFAMTTSPPESDRASSASPASPSCGGNNGGAPAAASWPAA